MMERLLMLAALAVIGVVAYRIGVGLQLRRVRQARALDPLDPLLDGLRPDVPTIVYFTTPGCIPCQTMQRPALQRLAQQLADTVQIVEVDASRDPEAAQRWGVMSAPTTFVLDRHFQPRTVNNGAADEHLLRRQIDAAFAA